MRYPLALAVTLTVELPVYAGGLRAARLARVWPALTVALAVNLATHPLVWLALRGAGDSYWPRFVAVELAAWLAESLLIIAWLRPHPPPIMNLSSSSTACRVSNLMIGEESGEGAAPGFVVLLALAANAASCLAGLLLAVAATT